MGNNQFNSIEALQVESFRKLAVRSRNAMERRFELSLEQAVIIGAAKKWYKSDVGKQMCHVAEIKSVGEFAEQVYGLKKAMFERLRQVSEIPAEVVEAYKNSEKEERSLVGLLKFASGDEEAVEGESDKVATVFTLSWKRDEGNVSIRVDAEGNVKTTNNPQDIERAIELLQSMLATA
jgi:hypothetical protein